MNEKESGYIYILSNPCFKTYGDRLWLKIGRTTKKPETRKIDLQTATPDDFVVEASLKTSNIGNLEKSIHSSLNEFIRISQRNREFYRISLDSAKRILFQFALAREEIQNLVFYKDGVPDTTFDANGNEVKRTPPIPKTQKCDGELFSCSGRKWSASGYFCNGRFVVCNGSVANKATDSFKKDKCNYGARKACEEDGSLSPERKFTRDTPFSSPSKALCVVSGFPCCGLAGWKTKDGRGIRDVYPDYKSGSIKTA